MIPLVDSAVRKKQEKKNCYQQKGRVTGGRVAATSGRGGSTDGGSDSGYV